MQTPEVVPARESFDLFNFPPDHPARSTSDTYYVNDTHILRTHTTIMWYYYLMLPEIKAAIARGESLGLLSFGKVYRKDEIDRKHMNVFHQMDGLFLCRKSEKNIGTPELQDILVAIAQAIFGKDVKYRINPDSFPYTNPSMEMEVDLNGNWVEVLGSGVVMPGCSTISASIRTSGMVGRSVSGSSGSRNFEHGAPRYPTPVVNGSARRASAQARTDYIKR